MTLVGNRLQWVRSGGVGGVCAQCRMMNAEWRKRGWGRFFLRADGSRKEGRHDA